MVRFSHARCRHRDRQAVRRACRFGAPRRGCRERAGVDLGRGLDLESDDQASEAGLAKLRREQFGHSSERRSRLIDQLELQLEELEAATTEDEIEALNVAKTSTVDGLERRRPTRKHLLDHLPRERMVIEAPTTCSFCGSDRIVKLDEGITETLEVIPRQWKVAQTVREKINQLPAPFHPTPWVWAEPNLPTMVLFEKFRPDQPPIR